jgi:hypothetical protein
MRVARHVLSALFLIAIFRIPSALAQAPVTPDLEEGQATSLEARQRPAHLAGLVIGNPDTRTEPPRPAGPRLSVSGQADFNSGLTGGKYDCCTRLGIRESLVVVQSQPKVSTDDGKTSWTDTPGVAGELQRADVG